MPILTPIKRRPSGLFSRENVEKAKRAGRGLFNLIGKWGDEQARNVRDAATGKLKVTREDVKEGVTKVTEGIAKTGKVVAQETFGGLSRVGKTALFPLLGEKVNTFFSKPELEKKLFGRETRPYQETMKKFSEKLEKLGATKTEQKLGAVAFGVGGTLLDLPGGSVAKGLFKKLAKETSEEVIEGILKSELKNIPEETLPALKRELAQAKTEQEVKSILNSSMDTRKSPQIQTQKTEKPTLEKSQEISRKAEPDLENIALNKSGIPSEVDIGQPREITKVPQRSNIEKQAPVKSLNSFAQDTSTLKTSQEFNTSKLHISSDAKKIIEDELETIRPRLEKKIGKTLSNREVQDFADGSSKLLRRVVGREETRQWESAMLKLRQRLANAAESEKVTKEFLDDLLAVKSLGADIGRKLQSFSIGADPKSITNKQALLSEILKMTDDTEKILEAAKGIDFNNLKQAAEFYRKFVKPSLGEWVDLVRYNSMLSSPLTHIVNIFSNLMNSSVRAPLTKLVSGGLDLLSSSATGQARKQFAGEAGAYIEGYLRNFQEAVKRFSEVWKGTRNFTNIDLQRTIPLATEGAKAGVEKVLSVPMRLLEGADQFFTALSEGGEKAALNLRKAKGVNVDALDKQVEEAARYGLFRQELFPEGQGTILNGLDTVTSAIESLRNSKDPFISTIAKFTVPFIRTPTNIFKQGIEYSPLGFATAIKSQKKLEQLSKALIGTGIATTAGILLASNRMTWAEPRTANERNAFRENGMQPYSIKLGDRWYSYQKLPPFIGFPLSMIALVNDAIKNKELSEDNGELILSTVAKYAEFLSDQSYFKSIGDLFNALSGDEFAISQLVGNYLQQLVPFRAFGGWMSRLTDRLQRQIDNKANFIDKQIQLLMLNVPFLSQQLPARKGPSGEVIESRDKVINALSPIKTIKQSKEESKSAQRVEEARVAIKKQNKERTDLKEEALALDAELQELSKEAANKRALQIKKENPQLFEKLKDVIEERKLGLTYEEKLMKQLGVENGERAKYIDAQIMKLPTSAERKAYYKELRDKKIISDEVEKQIRKLKKKPNASL